MCASKLICCILLLEFKLGARLNDTALQSRLLGRPRQTNCKFRDNLVRPCLKTQPVKRVEGVAQEEHTTEGPAPSTGIY